MINYARHLQKTIKNHFNRYKEVLILLGARQVGKTTLLKNCFPEGFFLTVDNESVRRNLELYDVSVYRQILPIDEKVKTVIIDEIHLLTNPGRAAKIIFDQLDKINLIITGSSSLEIKNRTSESLAGRKIDYHLYPLTFSEILVQKGIENKLNFNIVDNILKNDFQKKIHNFDLGGVMANILVYGSYPALIDKVNDEKYLLNLVDSVIFKDLIELRKIDNRPAALNLLRLLAYQIGSLVNISELSNRLNIDIDTVKRYLTIFEQSLIIFPLRPFTSQKRDEIGKMSKYYFYDLGLRNALVEDFKSIFSRQDYGHLFENFIISEVLKINNYENLGWKMNFWRTKQGSEIDLVLTKGEKIIGCEIKVGKSRDNKSFINRYLKAKMIVLTMDNFY